MTASEFAFLALGLILGTAAGAALLEVLRSRPPAPREVRVTMARVEASTRASTFAGDPMGAPEPGPAAFGPGDRRLADRPADAPASMSAEVGPPLLRPSMIPVFATAGGPPLVTVATPAIRTPVLEPVAAASARSAPPAAVGIAVPPAAVAIAVPPADAAGVTIVAAAAPRPTDPPAGRPGPVPADAGPCAELRAVAEDRCAVAARAREGAATAAAALQAAQREYDDEIRRAEEADAIADPRRVLAAKDEAQRAYRAAHDRAASHDDLEDAARTWLAAIDRINLDAREASSRATRARTAANALVTTLERLTAEADAARIGKEVAEEACLAARQSVAECEEAAAMAATAAVAARPAPTPAPMAPAYPVDEPELAIAGPGAGGEARIIRLLQGDRDALLRTVADLGGDDPAERRRWQVALTGLVDAVVAQAIDASVVDVPDRPAFWEPFTSAQRRDVVAALASLGYRYDGLGGFADGRVPGQRDLSLALGYAGLDPMRVRRWPTEAEAHELLSEARVAADEYLAGAAGGLSLSEMVDLLGRRAEGLTDLWNDWGRVRPLLLAVDRAAG